MKSNGKNITLVALLATIIALSASFKLPGIIPGTEFQMSAPIAIGICATFGFRKYISAGMIASIINLIMGTHTILNVVVAMVFRIVVGEIISVFGTSLIVVSLVGPIGTFMSRVVMSKIIGVNLKVLLITSIPGMIYTVLFSYFIYKLIEKITKLTPYKDYIKKLKVN
ncbi:MULTISPECIES: hypothetical protein [unclassified Romboutsia]|uniref:hypothetical protein n=1 Tax=unclassified Romboutsia TaxID=2626894 RepID=UPI0008232637|nr:MULTISPECIES: hypothetical protein [unclassified Romboutsia]SCI26079.1 Uncharacterised protein [uncultured Clostridium sp.]